jgi:hypothetical protein
VKALHGQILVAMANHKQMAMAANHFTIESKLA